MTAQAAGPDGIMRGARPIGRRHHKQRRRATELSALRGSATPAAERTKVSAVSTRLRFLRRERPHRRIGERRTAHARTAPVSSSLGAGRA